MHASIERVGVGFVSGPAVQVAMCPFPGYQA